MPHCHNCGNELQGGMKFCPACGQDQSIVVSHAQDPPTVVATDKHLPEAWLGKAVRIALLPDVFLPGRRPLREGEGIEEVYEGPLLAVNDKGVVAGIQEA